MALTNKYQAKREIFFKHKKQANVAETSLKLNYIALDINDESYIFIMLMLKIGKKINMGSPGGLTNAPTEKRYQYPTSMAYRSKMELIYLIIPAHSLLLPCLYLLTAETKAIFYYNGQYLDDNYSKTAKYELLILLLQWICFEEVVRS